MHYRWTRRAASAFMTAFVVMPSTLPFPNAGDATFATAVRDGDAAFQAFDNETALDCYQRAFAIDSTDCDVLWKLARANVDRGIVAPADEKVVWFASSEGFARRAVALFPDSSEDQGQGMIASQMARARHIGLVVSRVGRNRR
ncbi:MAG: tetratricopeptide repeat protein [Candidatus Latescibacteria bacterium]|nr:tetratricopeptide repeat protein [Candidatus Latescibacterota bacterium]